MPFVGLAYCQCQSQSQSELKTELDRLGVGVRVGLGLTVLVLVLHLPLMVLMACLALSPSSCVHICMLSPLSLITLYSSCLLSAFCTISFQVYGLINNTKCGTECVNVCTCVSVCLCVGCLISCQQCLRFPMIFMRLDWQNLLTNLPALFPLFFLLSLPVLTFSLSLSLSLQHRASNRSQTETSTSTGNIRTLWPAGDEQQTECSISATHCRHPRDC